ncbi:unnamed protein product [Ascophyllum nodosum]
MIFDVASVLFWILFAETLVHHVDDDDINEDGTERLITHLSIPPGLGAVCLLLGTTAACTATCNWEKSGAPDAVAVVEGRLPTIPSMM